MSLPPIQPVGGVSKSVELQPARNSEPGKTSAASLFEGILEQANIDQKDSNKAIKDLIEGKTDSVQQVVMTVAKAEMSFQMFMEIRNKLIESYNELMRMQF